MQRHDVHHLHLGTDTHRTGELDLLRWGIDVARRGGLTADDVLNTRPLPELLEGLRRG